MKSTSRMFKALLGGILPLAFALVGQAGAQTWTQLSPAGGPPVTRASHSAVPDTATNRMVIFGGGSGYPVPTMLNDLWVLDSADGLGGTPTWTQLNPPGTIPSARGFHSSVYDPATNRMIVFGGNQAWAFCFNVVNDVWVLSNANGLGGTPSWQQLTPAGGPPSARYQHSAVYDPANNRMIVFGGDVPCGSGNGEVWILTNANGLGGTLTWIQLSPIGGPGAVSGHSAVYDPGSNRMIVSIDCGSVTCGTDVWMLSNANGLGGTPTWTKLNPTGGPPPRRSNHSAVYDPATNRMTINGGQGCTGFCNDVWVLSHANGLGGTPNWTQLSPVGGPPDPRIVHSAVLNPASNRMTVFGGLTNTGGCCSTLGDVWVLTGAVVCGDGSLDVGEDCDDGNTTNGDCCSAMCEFEVGSCDDGDACTTGDACSMGSCVGGAPPTCNDSNVCTDDSCNPATGCVFTNNTAACDDSNACTQTDTCQAGSCTGSNPVVCTASDQCHDVGTCDPATGVCSNPAKADGTACSDGNACTQTDTCLSGVCNGGTQKDCSTSGLFSAHCRPSDGMCCGKTARRGGTMTCVP